MHRLNSGSSHLIRIILNGEAVEGRAEPRMLLTDFLRHVLARPGTHVGCEHGVCGACTIRIDGMMARGCMTLASRPSGSVVHT